MKIHLKKLVLWSRFFPGERRELPFFPKKVNVITGNSQTGKSAIIPIIDYCLCSSQCKIPLGKIRNSCSWFGVLFGTEHGDIFLARRSPQGGKPSTEVVLIAGRDIQTPETIIESNINIVDARKRLNTLFEFPFHMQEDLENNGLAARPSFRDVVSLCFQPQTIIANPDVFFYKCNEAIYAERLRLIFPFLLNAIKPSWYDQREELRMLRNELREVERESQSNLRLKKNAASSAKAKLLKAKNLGIYHNEILDQASVEHCIHEISSIVESKYLTHAPVFDDRQAQAIIESIVKRERELSLEYASLKQRLKFIVEVGTLYNSNMNSLRRRKDYLDLAESIISHYKKDESCPFCGAESSVFAESISLMLESVSSFEDERKKWGKTYNTALGLERLEITEKIKEVEHQLFHVGQERNAFVKDVEERNRLRSWTQEVDSLIGELSEYLSTIIKLLPQDNYEKVIELKTKINKLSKETSSEEIQKLKEEAVSTISEISFNYCNMLDIEWSDNRAKLDIQNLTVRIENTEGDAFLWEIGSASNWLAYHLGFMLGIHEFASTHSKHVPTLIVFDQPTQAYFPTVTELEEGETYWDDDKTDDTRRSNNIFKLLDEYIDSTDGKVQVILFEHAPVSMFSSYENIHVVEEWREKKLLPAHWYEEQSSNEETPE